MISPKRKIYSVSILFIFLILGLVFCFISPLFSTIKKDSLGYLSQKENLILIEKKKKELTNIERIYADIEPSLSKIDAFFVNAEEPVDFINFLEKSAKQLNLSIQISLREKEIEKKPWPGMYFQIETAGSFSNFMKFLEKLESVLYLIEVENMDIKKASEAQARFRTIPALKSDDVQIILDIKVRTE
jgi:Tfp pilus assembly protein PilO